MTNDAIATLLNHMLEKLNRIEATLADKQPIVVAQTGETIDVAVELLENAIKSTKRQTAELQAMMLDIRRGR